MDTSVAHPHPALPEPAFPGARPRRRCGRTGWIALTAAASAIGLFSLRYALPHVPLAPPLPNLTQRRVALGVHAVCAGVALIVGPWQFVAGLRMRRPALHRALGWIYLGGVAAGGIAALRLAPNADFGTISAWGFGTLGVLWIGSAAMALARILQGRIADHRIWMIRCFALTAGAVTLRIQLPLSQMIGIPFPIAYPAVSWTSWVPNLIAVEIWLRRRAFRSATG